jgi:DNA-binding NarL/FixJ family response regulator
MAKIQVLLIEDNRLLREGVNAILASQADMAIFAAEPSDESRPHPSRRHGPHIILFDAGLSGPRGFETLGNYRGSFPEAKIILMGTIPAGTTVTEYVCEGFSGFVDKNASAEEFLSTIRSVAAGQLLLPQAIKEVLFSEVRASSVPNRQARVNSGSYRLTHREQEVIRHIGDGLSNKDIAKGMFISVHTVKSHVHNIFDKLGLHTRLEIALHQRTTENSRSKHAPVT